MPAAVIVDAIRTPGGKRHGKLSGWHPADLAAETLKALVARNDLDPELVDDVIMGCVMQVGAQASTWERPQDLLPGSPIPFQPRPWTASAVRRSKPSTLPPRASWPAPTTSRSPPESRS
jgi:hypothetical protein